MSHMFDMSHVVVRPCVCSFRFEVVKMQTLPVVHQIQQQRHAVRALNPSFMCDL